MFLLHLSPAGQESWLTMWESTKLPSCSTAKVLWFVAPLLQGLLPTHCLSLAGPSGWTPQEQHIHWHPLILQQCRSADTQLWFLVCLCPAGTERMVCSSHCNLPLDLL